jgi:hypothetical protein
VLRRAALAAKEAQLQESRAKLDGAEEALADLPTRFAQVAAGIAAQQRELENCRLEAEGEAANLEQARLEAAAGRQAAAAAAAEAARQLELAAALAASVAAEAAQHRAQAELAGRAASKLAEVRQAEEAVQRQVAEAEAAAGHVQQRVREVAGKRAKLQHELGLAEASAAAARCAWSGSREMWCVWKPGAYWNAEGSGFEERRFLFHCCFRARVPELEASKKAAAAARDFKAAGEAAAEAKAAAAEAAAAEERSATLKEQAAAAAAEEQQLQAEAAEAEAALAALSLAAARARWRGLLGAHAELQKQIAHVGDGGADGGELEHRAARPPPALLSCASKLHQCVPGSPMQVICVLSWTAWPPKQQRWRRPTVSPPTKQRMWLPQCLSQQRSRQAPQHLVQAPPRRQA